MLNMEEAPPLVCLWAEAERRAEEGQECFKFGSLVLSGCVRGGMWSTKAQINIPVGTLS